MLVLNYFLRNRALHLPYKYKIPKFALPLAHSELKHPKLVNQFSHNSEQILQNNLPKFDNILVSENHLSACYYLFSSTLADSTDLHTNGNFLSFRLSPFLSSEFYNSNHAQCQTISILCHYLLHTCNCHWKNRSNLSLF